MEEAYKIIPVKDIQTNPYQPRQQFDQDYLEELAQSIRENGLIQPLIVRPSAVVGYELMAGERRLRASQIAGLEAVPALVRQLTDQEMMTQAIIENLQRRDLSPIEEARAYKNLMAKGNTHDTIARVMGKSRPYISNMVRLLNLSRPVLEALEGEKISQGHARTLLGCSSKEQEDLLDKIITEKMSVHQLEKLLQQKKVKAPSSKKDLFIAESEKEISRLLGTPVKITQNKQGQGQISIAFSSLEEFDRIINTLK